MWRRERKGKKTKTTSVSLSVNFWCFLRACVGGREEEEGGEAGGCQMKLCLLEFLNATINGSSKSNRKKTLLVIRSVDSLAVLWSQPYVHKPAAGKRRHVTEECERDAGP